MAPVAAASVVAVALFMYVPGRQDTPKQSGPKQSGNADIEQVAQAVDDLDLLTPIDK